jgi:hypothetical protein
MLDDLERHSFDTTEFRDRIPYVLDLLAGVTRTIDDESRGHRTPQFVLGGQEWTVWRGRPSRN